MPDRPPSAQPRTTRFAGSRPPGSASQAWDETGADDVDIKRQVHRLCSLPSKFQRGLDDLSTPTRRRRRRSSRVPPSDLHPGARSLPSADTDLYEVRCRSVGDVCGVEPRCRVHPFVEVEFLEADGSAKG